MTLVAECTIESRPQEQRLDTLAALARRGDAEAPEDLLLAVRPLVYRWAWMHTADADDAEDVTQAVLLRVHTRIGEFDGRSSLATWLYRITSNACVELHRRRSAWRRLRDRWSNHAASSGTLIPDALDHIASERTVEIIRKMMTTLSGKQRAAVDLVDLQGYEPIEAARMMDMNPATLRTHLLRGRTAIRNALLMEE